MFSLLGHCECTNWDLAPREALADEDLPDAMPMAPVFDSSLIITIAIKTK